MIKFRKFDTIEEAENFINNEPLEFIAVQETQQGKYLVTYKQLDKGIDSTNRIGSISIPINPVNIISKRTHDVHNGHVLVSSVIYKS